MATELTLRDGRRALAWSVLPGDREAIRLGYDPLSPQSRYHRFLTGVPHLTEPLLDHLVDEVDGVDHVALVLFVLDDDNLGVPAGVGRIIRYPDDPTCADVAVTVLDHWQGQGVATALLAELLRQRPYGVTTLRTTVAEDNPPSLAMLKRLGPTTVTSEGTGRLGVLVELPPVAEPAQPPVDTVG
jgi:RimJ/RimL family protein N-acetyltransferase